MSVESSKLTRLCQPGSNVSSIWGWRWTMDKKCFSPVQPDGLFRKLLICRSSYSHHCNTLPLIIPWQLWYQNNREPRRHIYFLIIFFKKSENLSRLCKIHAVFFWIIWFQPMWLCLVCMWWWWLELWLGFPTKKLNKMLNPDITSITISVTKPPVVRVVIPKAILFSWKCLVKKRKILKKIPK